MEIGWTKPKEAPANWDDAKIKAANFNSKAVNVLFSVVTNEEFKKISSTKTAKEAWIILQITYEGPRLSRIQSFRGLPRALKRLRLKRMSHSMRSMLSLRT